MYSAVKKNEKWKRKRKRESEKNTPFYITKWSEFQLLNAYYWLVSFIALSSWDHVIIKVSSVQSKLKNKIE